MSKWTVAIFVLLASGPVASGAQTNQHTPTLQKVGHHASERHDEHRAHDQHEGAHDEGSGEPLPFLIIMQQLGVHMMTLTHGLMYGNSDSVREAADAMAHHAPIREDDIVRIGRILGDDMPEFEKLDAAVHNDAVALTHAASSGKAEAVLDALNKLQHGCVACHSRFRDRLRTRDAVSP